MVVGDFSILFPIYMERFRVREVHEIVDTYTKKRLQIRRTFSALQKYK